jgi:hypothetical protein
MIPIKAQIIQTVEQMDDDSAFAVWDLLSKHFETPFKKISWDDIEEIEPDKIDRQMLSEIESDPDCKVFISEEELFSRIN